MIYPIERVSGEMIENDLEYTDRVMEHYKLNNELKSKDEARQQAISCSKKAVKEGMCFIEFFILCEHFIKTGERFGLSKEFSDNNIIGFSEDDIKIIKGEW